MFRFGLFQDAGVMLLYQCNLPPLRSEGEKIIYSSEYMQKKAFAKIQYPFIKNLRNWKKASPEIIW